ncbi:MAG: nitroreductase family deazaflavin-dependent oxidoreductase [Chloroflexi bacterium]|nr:nitroreductase family deazaflavin-dependent oxidoreductase [Chloroflexota bacterium]
MTATGIQNKPPLVFRLLVKAQNPFMKRLLWSPFHGLVSRSYLLITFKGRKSGAVYTTPVQYAQDGGALYIITSAGYTWWKNLRGGADVWIRLRGQSYQGRAEVSDDPQCVGALAAKIYPGLSAERRAKFVPGKIAITITLDTGAA